jgi:hypothetical protein
MPARALEQIPVQRVLDALRRVEDQPTPSQPGDTLKDDVSRLFTAIDRATSDTLSDLTIRDLVIQHLPDGDRLRTAAKALGPLPVTPTLDKE